MRPYLITILLVFALVQEPEPITQLHPILERDCNPIFNDIVSKCTEADQALRYRSAEEIAAIFR